MMILSCCGLLQPQKQLEFINKAPWLSWKRWLDRQQIMTANVMSLQRGPLRSVTPWPIPWKKNDGAMKLWEKNMKKSMVGSIIIDIDMTVWCHKLANVPMFLGLAHRFVANYLTSTKQPGIGNYTRNNAGHKLIEIEDFRSNICDSLHWEGKYHIGRWISDVLWGVLNHTIWWTQ